MVPKYRDRLMHGSIDGQMAKMANEYMHIVFNLTERSVNGLMLTIVK